ncbi:MAG: aminotransferase class V-fold PLP-dependent enzyme [Steroidobacteraceae bacterium]
MAIASDTSGTPARGQRIDWAKWREQFPVLERRTYLNSCSYGALPLAGARAFEDYVAHRIDVGADWDAWVASNEALRAAVAGLLQADADEVAITATASAGFNALASALSFKGERRKVIVTDLDFPTNGQIWYAQALRGAEIVRLPATNGTVRMDEFEKAIDDRTLLVTTSHVNYLTGARLDLPQLVKLAHSHGAYVCIDEFQALGTLRQTACTAGADFVVGGMYKYLLGTAGVAYLYVRRELQAALVPTQTGWFAQEDIMAMDVTAYRPAANARRFEAGTPPVVAGYVARAGLDVIQGAGLAAIELRVRELTAEVKDEARRCGYRMLTPSDAADHGAMIAVASHDPSKLVAALASENVTVTSRGGAIRIAMHAYNNSVDIEKAFKALHKHQSLIVR